MSFAPAAIALRRLRDIAPVWHTLIGIYGEVRADRHHDPHYSVERSGERLSRHPGETGWEAVIGYDGQQPVGYVYGNTIEAGGRCWARNTPPAPESLTRVPTLVVRELMVGDPWHKAGGRTASTTNNSPNARRGR